MTDLSAAATALIALGEKASPGPWLPDESGYGSCYGRNYKNVDCPDAGAGVAACWAYSFSLHRSLPAEANAAFIAHARTAAPALAAAYLAMRKIIDMMKETIARSTHDSEVFQDFNEIEAAILAFERATGGDHD